MWFPREMCFVIQCKVKAFSLQETDWRESRNVHTNTLPLSLFPEGRLWPFIFRSQLFKVIKIFKASCGQWEVKQTVPYAISKEIFKASVSADCTSVGVMLM